MWKKILIGIVIFIILLLVVASLSSTSDTSSDTNSNNTSNTNSNIDSNTDKTDNSSNTPITPPTPPVTVTPTCGSGGKTCMWGSAQPGYQAYNVVPGTTSYANVSDAQYACMNTAGCNAVVYNNYAKWTLRAGCPVKDDGDPSYIAYGKLCN